MVLLIASMKNLVRPDAYAFGVSKGAQAHRAEHIL